jgi:hypothetical protein
MRWLLTALAALLILFALVVAVGSLVPREHVAAVRATYRAAPDEVFRTIHDVARGAEWRGGLQRVEVIDTEGDRLRWRETADWGVLTFQHDEVVPGRRVVARIVDEGQGFGGTWSWDIEPAGSGSRVTITEHGVIDNPLYRFMSRYLMGYYASLESYAADLGRRLGEDVDAQRVRR